MIIKRDQSIEKWFFDETRNNWGKDAREHIHLSDLLAPKKAYWQRVKPMYPTDEEIMYWSSGQGHESAMLRASGYEHGKAQEWKGIWFTPDMFQSMPIEIKTRRRNLAEEGREEDEYDYYLKQLKGYCAVSDKPQGWLWVWCLVQKQDDGKTKPELNCFRVEFEKEDLENERGRLLFTFSMLNKALMGEIPYTDLFDCPSWMCGSTKKNMVIKPYCITCNRGFETDWGIDKHINSKTGKGHEVKKAEYEEYYEPRCKWYMDCKGNK